MTDEGKKFHPLGGTFHDYDGYKPGPIDSIVQAWLSGHISQEHALAIFMYIGGVDEARADAYNEGYNAGLFEAFGEASIQVLRDSGDYPHIAPSEFEGEYGTGAAAVMNWINKRLTESGGKPRNDD